MRFETPSTIEAALELLAAPGARCLAGGQSLGAMMNAHLIEPAMLVSLRDIAELRRVDALPDGGVRIGAMVTYRALADLPVTSGATMLVAESVRLIAHPAIRNQGTIGGSLCHADPAGDLPTLVTCAGATLRIAGAAGVREVAAENFFLDYYETVLQPGEMLVSVDLPGTPAGAQYEKFMLTEGDFAAVSVAAMIGRGFARVAVGACGATPMRVAAADALLLGSGLDDDGLAEAAALLVAACDPIDDSRGSRDYRLRLVPRLLRRAVLGAKARAEEMACLTS